MNLADLTHLHLLLNYVPIIGLVLGLAVLLVALLASNDRLTQAGFVVFFLGALVTFPTFVTGYAAHTAIQARPDYSAAAVQAHQATALLATAFMEIVGVIAWFGLWRFRQFSHPGRWTSRLVLLLCIVTTGLMLRAAVLGSEITHNEIHSGPQSSGTERNESDLNWLTTPSISSFTSTYRWTWPLCETLHFLGLCLLFGVVLLINLRILGIGMLKTASFVDLHRLLPWGVAGFAVNAISGMVFYAAAPQTYTQNLAFEWKIVFIVLASAGVLYFTLFDEPWSLRPGIDASLTAKAIAATQIFLWVGIIFFGRMLPYLTGGAFAGAQ